MNTENDFSSVRLAPEVIYGDVVREFLVKTVPVMSGFSTTSPAGAFCKGMWLDHLEVLAWQGILPHSADLKELDLEQPERMFGFNQFIQQVDTVMYGHRDETRKHICRIQKFGPMPTVKDLAIVTRVIDMLSSERRNGSTSDTVARYAMLRWGASLYRGPGHIPFTMFHELVPLQKKVWPRTFTIPTPKYVEKTTRPALRSLLVSTNSLVSDDDLFAALSCLASGLNVVYLFYTCGIVGQYISQLPQNDRGRVQAYLHELSALIKHIVIPS